MANRLPDPDITFVDQNGTPYAGGTLTFYSSNTSTKLNTYADSALTIANPNPIILDSAGRAGSVFLSNSSYKVVLADVNGNQIWTQDPVATSDFTTIAQILTNPTNPNGNLAGQAGSGSIPASLVWDIADAQLFICTTTGTATSAVWTSVNPVAAATLTLPTGRLTLTSGTPVLAISTTVTQPNGIFYTPYLGNVVPIFNSGSFTSTTFSELTLALNATAHVRDSIYDVFVFLNNGTPTLVTGPVWSNVTPGACARGTGTGTSALQRVSGIYVNAQPLTGAINGTNSYNVPINQGTYLGSFYTDHVAGQVTCTFAAGVNRKYGLWNYYNRVPVILQVQNPNSIWAYSSSAYRATINQPSAWTATAFNFGGGNPNATGIVLFNGIGEEPFLVTLTQTTQITANSGDNIVQSIGIGFNSVTVPTGSLGSSQLSNGNASAISTESTLTARLVLGPAVGLNTVASLEATPVFTGAGTSNFLGAGQMLLTATYRA